MHYALGDFEHKVIVAFLVSVGEEVEIRDWRLEIGDKEERGERNELELPEIILVNFKWFLCHELLSLLLCTAQCAD